MPARLHRSPTPTDEFVEAGRRGRRRRSTPCCCATAARRSASSSPTAGRSRRCRRGASRAAARSTTSRSRTSSTTSRRIQLTPEESQEQLAERARRAAHGRRVRRTATPVFESARARPCSTWATRGNFAGGAYSLRPLPHRRLVRTHDRDERRPTTADRRRPRAFEATTELRLRRRPRSNLCDGDTERQFLGRDQTRSTSSATGSRADGMGYGRNGQGSGKMPGFGSARPRTTARTGSTVGVKPAEPRSRHARRQEQIEAIVEYERSSRRATARVTAVDRDLLGRHRLEPRDPQHPRRRRRRAAC